MVVRLDEKLIQTMSANASGKTSRPMSKPSSIGERRPVAGGPYPEEDLVINTGVPFDMSRVSSAPGHGQRPASRGKHHQPQSARSGTAGATGRRQTSSARLRQTVRDAPEQLDMRLASQVMFLSEKSLNVPSHLRGVFYATDVNPDDMDMRRFRYFPSHETISVSLSDPTELRRQIMKHMVHDALELFIIRIQKAMRCSIARKRVHAILVRKAKELANNERRKIKYTDAVYHEHDHNVPLEIHVKQPQKTPEDHRRNIPNHHRDAGLTLREDVGHFLADHVAEDIWATDGTLHSQIDKVLAPKNSASDAKARYDEMERKRTASDFTKETEKEQIPMVEEEIVVPTATASVATAIVGAAIDEAVKVASSRKA